MKASELRIGNLVLLKNQEGWPQYFGMPATVNGYDKRTDIHFPESNGTVNLCVDEHTFICQFDEFIEPIPLTEEWLLKFGFITDNHLVGQKYWLEYSIDGQVLYLSVDSFIENVFHYLPTYHREIKGIQIRYVHQLQNLYFALTGEELTIK